VLYEKSVNFRMFFRASFSLWRRWPTRSRHPAITATLNVGGSLTVEKQLTIDRLEYAYDEYFVVDLEAPSLTGLGISVVPSAYNSDYDPVS